MRPPASLANTLGGWILLGVTNSGTVAGWEKPDRLDLQSYPGSVLGQEVDPFPPFVAAMRQVDDKPIAVIGVFASADVPHIVRGSSREATLVYGGPNGESPRTT